MRLEVKTHGRTEIIPTPSMICTLSKKKEKENKDKTVTRRVAFQFIALQYSMKTYFVISSTGLN